MTGNLQLPRMRALNALFICTLVAARSVATAETPPQPDQAADSWGKIVLIGASVTAGFTRSEPLGGPRTEPYQLNRYVDAAISAPHEPIANFSMTFFFTKPDEIARDQIATALAAKPGAILSTDFLFWWCYGKLKEGETRAARFEHGLKLLEAIECPLVIGDIPDASEAKGGMLSVEEVPDLTDIEAANVRLREWAATRKNVAIFPVAAFMKSANADEPIAVREVTLPAGSTRGLLQSDRLHPGRHGCAALTLALLDKLVTLDPGFSPTDVNWDAEALFQKVNPTKAKTAHSPRK